MRPTSIDQTEDGFHERNGRAFCHGQIHLAVAEAEARGVLLQQTPGMPLSYLNALNEALASSNSN